MNEREKLLNLEKRIPFYTKVCWLAYDVARQLPSLIIQKLFSSLKWQKLLAENFS